MIRTAFVLLMAMQLFGGGEKNTREGAEHFEAGRLEEALRAFSRAEGAFPDAPENDLNIAGVHYRLGEAEGGPASGGEEGPLAEALRGYQAALGGGADGEVRRDAFYNLANTLFRAGAFREAAAAYGEAIALDPDDREARQNLERALRAADDQNSRTNSRTGGRAGTSRTRSNRSRTNRTRSNRSRISRTRIGDSSRRTRRLPAIRTRTPGRGGSLLPKNLGKGRISRPPTTRAAIRPRMRGRARTLRTPCPARFPKSAPSRPSGSSPRSPTSSGPSRRTVSKNAGLARFGGAH